MIPSICIACHEPVAPGRAVIVGLDIKDFPARIPENVLAHHACENQARNIIALALVAQEQRHGRE
jgi:hypothetical protein